MLAKQEVLISLFSITVAASLGCASDSETPTSAESDPHELVATVHIDTCESYPPIQPGVLDALCGSSSDIRASFELVYPDIKKEYEGPGGAITRKVTFRTGPGTWEFSDPGFRDALLDHFAGRPVKIVARRTVGPSSDVREIFLQVMTGNSDVYYILGMECPHDMPVDADGFPVIENAMTLSGPIRIQQHRLDGYQHAAGNADLRIKNIRVLPVRQKPEPPVVGRPTLTAQELRAAPSTLEFGDKKLAFQRASAYRPALYLGITATFLIMEESLRDLEEARLDFVWVVHESGVWEPEIASKWDTHYFEVGRNDGPKWPIDTDVDIVVGFVDLNGDVSLMGITKTIFLAF